MSNYRFDHFKDFFAYQIQLDQQKTPNRKSDTLTKLIRKLGFKSPSLLSMIAKGQRLPSAALLEALLDKWEIPQNERELIRVQVEIERRLKKDKEVLPLLDRLKRLQGKNQFEKLNFNKFEVIRHWYIYVLKELIDSKDFVEDPMVLSRKLRNKVTPAQVKKGIDSLLEAGLIRRNQETGKLESVLKDSETLDGIASEAIREFHKSMMERAIESLNEQSVNERDIRGLTLRVDEDKLKEVSQKILEFMKNMNELYQSDHSESVYQLNVQFFAHTRKVSAGGQNENQ